MPYSSLEDAEVGVTGSDSDSTDAEEQLLLHAGMHKVSTEERRTFRRSTWLSCVIVLAVMLLVAVWRAQAESSDYATSKDGIGSFINLALDAETIAVARGVAGETASMVTSMMKDGQCKKAKAIHETFFGKSVFIESHRGEYLGDENGHMKIFHHSEIMAAGDMVIWQISDAGSDTVFIKSHGKNLMDNNGEVQMTSKADSAEKWKISDAGKNNVFITSPRNQQLGDHDDHAIMNPNRGGWEKWTIVEEKEIKKKKQDEAKKNKRSRKKEKEDKKETKKAKEGLLTCTKHVDLFTSIGNDCAEVAIAALQPHVAIVCGVVAVAGSCSATAFDHKDKLSLEDISHILHKGFKKIGMGFGRLGKGTGDLKGRIADLKRAMSQEVYNVEQHLEGLRRTKEQEARKIALSRKQRSRRLKQAENSEARRSSKRNARSAFQQRLAGIKQKTRSLTMAHKILLNLGYKAKHNYFCPPDIAKRFQEFEADFEGKHLKQLIQKQMELNFPRQNALDLGIVFLVVRNYVLFFEIVCAAMGKDSRDVVHVIIPRYKRDMKEYTESILMTYAYGGYLPESEFSPPGHVQGDLKDLPTLVTTVTSIRLPNNQKITGDLKHFPKTVTKINLSNNGKISGGLKDLPESVIDIDLSVNQLITGDLKDLSKSVISIDLTNNQKITGDLKDLPNSLKNINLAFSFKITGELKDLPTSVSSINLAHNWIITGRLSDLPRSVTSIDLSSNHRIRGDIKDLPKSLSKLILAGTDTITGDLKDLPRSVTYISLVDNKKITGDLKDLPASVTKINLHGNDKITGVPKDNSGLVCAGCRDLAPRTPAPYQ